MKLHIKGRVLIILSALVGTLIFTITRPMHLQPQEYHNFVDTRSMFGIPNAMNVLSNIFFAIAGSLGIREMMRAKSWLWFFISVLLVAPGSAYYHLSPVDATLVWDRLPMSMAFMALYIALLSEHITESCERYLYPAMSIGVLSVIVWAITGDLRFYFWVQFSSFLTIPLILILFKSRYSLRIFYIVCLAFYMLAKWAEVKDKEIFEVTNQFISGHTLKHVLAAIGLLCLWWMVTNRKLKKDL